MGCLVLNKHVCTHECIDTQQEWKHAVLVTGTVLYEDSQAVSELWHGSDGWKTQVYLE